MDAEFLVDMVGVALHRGVGDDELLHDEVRLCPSAKSCQHFGLARGEVALGGNEGAGFGQVVRGGRRRRFVSRLPGSPHNGHEHRHGTVKGGDDDEAAEARDRLPG